MFVLQLSFWAVISKIDSILWYRWVLKSRSTYFTHHFKKWYWWIRVVFAMLKGLNKIPKHCFVEANQSQNRHSNQSLTFAFKSSLLTVLIISKIPIPWHPLEVPLAALAQLVTTGESSLPALPGEPWVLPKYVSHWDNWHSFIFYFPIHLSCGKWVTIKCFPFYRAIASFSNSSLRFW